MSLVIGALTLGLILSLLAMGVWISFRALHYCDITVDGTITLGASVTALLLTRGWPAVTATAVAVAAGALAGVATGVLHTRFRIQELLSGILVMTALYSVNLRIMGRSNIPLLNVAGVDAPVNTLLVRVAGGKDSTLLFGWSVPLSDLAMLGTVALVAIAVAFLLHLFLNTHLGVALRATGENPQMVRAQGINNHAMLVLGLASANALVGLAGALLAQYQGFADVQMGIGMMVWGLASIIIGEALVGRNTPAYALCGTIMGAILFRMLIAIALRWGLNPNDLKLVTAVFVFIALVLPNLLKGQAGRLFKGMRHA